MYFMILKIMIRRIVGWNFIIAFKYIVAVTLHLLISTHGAFLGSFMIKTLSIKNGVIVMLIQNNCKTVRKTSYVSR